MKNSIYLRKIKLTTLLKICKNKNIDLEKIFVSLPFYEKDIKIYNTIPLGDYKVEIKNYRILPVHKKFMFIIHVAVENGAIERLIKKNIIQENIINNLINIFKNEDDVFRYILKWMFLPLKQTILPDGKVVLTVSSQAFDELPEDKAQDFFNKCYEFIADLFETSLSEVLNWGKQYKKI